MARGCLVEGCGRWVKAGKVVCGVHARTEVGRAIVGEVRGLLRELERVGEAMEGEDGERVAGEAAKEAVREVRRRVGRGDFGRLLGESKGRQGAEGVLGRALEDEMAALRVLLWRLIGDEEVDVVRQAQAVSQVVGMTVRAAREQAIMRRAGEGVERRRIVAVLELLGEVDGGRG